MGNGKTDDAIIIYGGPLFDGKGNVFEDAAIYIENGKILFIGDEEEVFKTLPKNVNIEYYDTKGRIILPGLINMHHHLYFSIAKGLIPKSPIESFHNKLEGFWWKFDKVLDKEITQISVLLGLLDSIKSGVTTLFDQYSSPADIENSLDVISSAIERAELQAVLCYSISDIDGKEIFKEGLEENLRFIDVNKDNKLVKGILGLNSNYAISEESMKEIELKFEPEIGLHIHCPADSEDVKYCKEIGYGGPVDRLNKFNLLSPKSILSRGAYLNKGELKILKEKKSCLVYNPESNMMNNTGNLKIPLIKDLLIGLGTCGISSNMLHTFRLGYLSHRQSGIDENTIFDCLNRYLFEDNSRIASRFFDGKPGILEKGGNADIVILDYIPVTRLTAANVGSNIVFGMYDRNALMVMKEGKFIYNEGTFLTLDEELIFEEAKRIGKRLWKKYYNETFIPTSQDKEP